MPSPYARLACMMLVGLTGLVICEAGMLLAQAQHVDSIFHAVQPSALRMTLMVSFVIFGMPLILLLVPDLLAATGSGIVLGGVLGNGVELVRDGGVLDYLPVELSDGTLFLSAGDLMLGVGILIVTVAAFRSLRNARLAAVAAEPSGDPGAP